MSIKFLRFFTGLVVVILFSLSGSTQAGSKVKSTLRMKSTSFQDGHIIPNKYTCKGDNISPELSWRAAPAGTKCFTLICEDPDAPQQSWTHWVIFNIPAKVDSEKNAFELLEGFPRQEKTMDGIFQGVNDFEKIGYDGPCPSDGLHQYFFKLYALDAPLKLPAGASKAQVLKAMEKHILAWTQIMGLYGK
jgi:Raf kinase inhibitor-like YbhB/YbcL family protein